MMRDVYVKAWRTLIWISKQDGDMLVVSDILHAMTSPKYDYCKRVDGARFQSLKERIERVIAIKSGILLFTIASFDHKLLTNRFP